jgi:hypothetical protein
MYSESDIEAAVASGAISATAAAAFRESVAQQRAAPAVDEESFRLITGFNDIFVSIAAILLLVALGWIGSAVGGGLIPLAADQLQASVDSDAGSQFTRHAAAMGATGGTLVAVAAWLLAEYFTRKRRMALPSILLLGAFVLSIGMVVSSIVKVIDASTDARTAAIAASIGGIATAGAAFLHWRRFHVPITIAALAGGLVVTLISLAVVAFPGVANAWLWLLLAAGLSTFTFAMWWDISDRLRQTRRSDVAFWLHLAAAPMIAHPIFNLMGVLNDNVGLITAVVVIALYILFGIVALAVDRRALLVSSLVYVLYALANLFKQAGAISLNIALTALVIGSALLLLSAFWHTARRLVVSALPEGMQHRLPVLDRPVAVTRPV